MPPVNHPYVSKLATKPSQAAILLRFHCDVSKAPTHRNEIVDYDVLVASCDASEAPTHRSFRRANRAVYSGRRKLRSSLRFCSDASQQNRKNRCQGYFNDAS